MKKLFLLYGNDASSIDCRIKEILEELSGSHGEVNLEQLKLEKKEDLELLFHRTINLQLFQKQIVLLINVDIKLRKAIDDCMDKVLSAINVSLSSSHIIIRIYIEKYDKTLKSQLSGSVLFRKLEQLAAIEEHKKTKFWEKGEMISKVMKLANKYNLDFQEDALDLFVEIYTNEFSDVYKDIHGELLKLQTYIAPQNSVTKQHVKDLYSSGYTMEDLYLTLIEGKKKIDFKLVLDLDKNLHALYLVSFLQNRFRQALQIKAHAHANINKYEISKLIGIHVYRIEKEISQLKNITLKSLKNKIKLISDVEYKMKSGLIGNKGLLDFFLPAVLVCK